MKAPGECENIGEIRHAIDVIDRQVIAFLGLRFEYVNAVMRFKSTEEEVRAPQRFRAVLDQRRVWAEEAGLPPDLMEDVYRLLIGYFIEHELQELARNGADQA